MLKKTLNKDQSSRKEQDDYKIISTRNANIFYAVISVFLAVLLWVFAVYSDSSSTTFVDVPVVIRNAETLTDSGYKIVLNIDAVSFSVKGRKNVVEKIGYDSIVPYVDLSEINANDSGAVVKIKYDKKYKLQINNPSNEVVQVYIIDVLESSGK